MKVSKDYAKDHEFVDYKLDCDDGDFCKSTMKLCTVEEIVRSSEDIRISDEIEGFEVVVNERMYFPKAVFEFDEDDGLVKESQPSTPKTAKRRKQNSEE